MGSTTQCHGSAALNAVLDDQPTAAVTAPGQEAGTEELAEQLAEEQLKRERAEAEAQDKASRLRVAQEQLSEWAQEKRTEAQRAAQAAAQAAQALDSVAASLPEQAAAALRAQLATLAQQLADSASEAHAFAVQQKAQADNLKRSLHQAGMEGQGDVDMKRQKEQRPTNGTTQGNDMEGDGAGGQQNGEGGGHDEGNDSSPHTTDTDEPRAALGAGPGLAQAGAAVVSTWAQRAAFIPMRLEQPDRRLLRLLEAALNVSEYTDKVDILSWRNKAARIHAQIKDICAILSGLVVAQDYAAGQRLVKDRGFADNATFFQDVFEVGRRYKIMNPDRMRSEYGKLMYLLMDSSDSAIQELLEFSCVKPLETVGRYLEARGGSKLLSDPLLEVATREIATGDRSRYEIQREIKAKEKARETLARRYANSHLTHDQVLTAIYSLSDNNTYLFFNRDPIDRMLSYFKACFRPTSWDTPYTLAIQIGHQGARLTHSHERQYQYVLQSLTLWREISTDMFKLWCLAEDDMLREGNAYRLCDTGQGLNRVQSAPKVARAMQAILSRCQAAIGGWVGSSVVHLGDHNVPNALMFIDKYTQVPRILNPVVRVLDELPNLYRDPQLRDYIDAAFGSLEDAQRTILTDFCRHAFDGSGADNFFDAGSCIDGRLTSAWNWCSKLEKKSYYPLFKLAGFNGFDGEFK